jgi:predicted PurR-regulated permease PerM
VALFVAALVIWFAARVAGVLLLVFLAMLTAVYLSAITDQLERRFRMPRWVGLTCTVVGTLALLVGAGALILPPVIDQTQALISALPQSLSDIQNVLAGWASQYPVLRRTELANPASGIVAQIIDDATTYLRGSLLPYLRAGGQVFIEGASVIVMGLYLARSPSQYRDGIVSLVAPRYRPVASRIVADAGATLHAWVVGQLLAMLVLGVLTALGLLILGAPYWLAFGVLAGVAAVVPFFGTMVSTVLPALFVVGTGDWIKVVAVLLLGVVVHVIEANFVGPLIMERKVSLPPVLTIASVLVMGTLFGVIGLVVAVPIVALVLLIVRHVVQAEIYGDTGHVGPAVLRTTERRAGGDRRDPQSVSAKSAV